MTVTLTQAKWREETGRDSMSRASMWQGAAGTMYGLNCVYADPTLATATTASKVKTTASAQFTVGGQIFTKGATDNFWTLSGTTIAAGTFQKYLLMVDDAGTMSVQEGVASTVGLSSVTWTNIATASAANPKNPWAPLCTLLNASRCIFGTLSVTNATNPFIPGTTLLSAAGVTVAYQAGIDPTLFPIIANERGSVLGISI